MTEQRTGTCSNQEKLLALARDSSGIDAIDLEAPFSELGLDSLEFLEFFMRLKEEFAVDVQWGAYPPGFTLYDVLRSIETGCPGSVPA